MNSLNETCVKYLKNTVSRSRYVTCKYFSIRKLFVKKKWLISCPLLILSSFLTKTTTFYHKRNCRRYLCWLH